MVGLSFPTGFTTVERLIACHTPLSPRSVSGTHLSPRQPPQHSGVERGMPSPYPSRSQPGSKTISSQWLSDRAKKKDTVIGGQYCPCMEVSKGKGRRGGSPSFQRSTESISSRYRNINCGCDRPSQSSTTNRPKSPFHSSQSSNSQGSTGFRAFVATTFPHISGS